MKRLTFVLYALALGLASLGCELTRRSESPLSPTQGTIQSYTGTWASSSLATPTPGTCNAFQWTPTTVEGNTITGTFTATCAGNVHVAGTGTGTLNVDRLAWSATGTASQGSVSCAFTLTGTAMLEGTDGIRVDYSGTVCGVAVSGSELMRRR
jgi:hypothetical protein